MILFRRYSDFKNYRKFLITFVTTPQTVKLSQGPTLIGLKSGFAGRNQIRFFFFSDKSRCFSDYETIGEFFREVFQETRQLSVAQQIWGIPQSIVNAIVELFGISKKQPMTPSSIALKKSNISANILT